MAGTPIGGCPTSKELQSIVDYTRSPDTTNSAAIDPVFQSTPIRDGLGKVNYPFYWSSTTHKKMGDGRAACYVAFGRSQGWMQGRSGSGEYRPPGRPRRRLSAQ